jgi:uncharacterized membrane protein
MIYLALTLLSFVPVFALAQEFVSLTGIDEIENAVKQDGVANLVNYFYVTLIGIAGVIAVFQFIKAGILYAGEAASMSKKAEAKKIMQQTVFGLILIMSPFLVFSIIDPRILSLKLITGKLLPPKQEITQQDVDKILLNSVEGCRFTPRSTDLGHNLIWGDEKMERKEVAIPKTKSIESLGGDANCCARMGGEIVTGTNNTPMCSFEKLIAEDRWYVTGIVWGQAHLKTENGGSKVFDNVKFNMDTPGTQYTLSGVSLGFDILNADGIVGIYPNFAAIYGFRSETECKKFVDDESNQFSKKRLLERITDNSATNGRIDIYRPHFNDGTSGAAANGDGGFPDDNLIQFKAINPLDDTDTTKSDPHAVSASCWKLNFKDDSL